MICFMMNLSRKHIWENKEEIGMNQVVITIARQYGSGGRTIGEELAKKLGISYYDKDIIRMASEESGIHEQLFGRADENVSTKQRFFAKSGIYKGELIPPQSKDFTSDENLFNYQAKVIRQLAETESCVIIGRSADYILKDSDKINLLRAFIYAPDDVRIHNIMESHNLTEKDARILLLEKDKRYHKRHLALTGSNRGDRHNRNILIDSSYLGIEGTADYIEELVRRKFGSGEE